MNKNQKGFGVIEGVLIFLIIAIIGGTGWYVWRSQKNTTNSYNNTSATLSSTVAPKSKNTQTSSKTANSAPQYLQISQLGIVIPLASSISDLAYQPFNDGGDPNGIELYSDSILGTLFNQIDSQCPATKETTHEHIGSSLPAVNYTVLSTVTVGSTKYYLYKEGTSFCGNDGSLWHPTSAQQSQINSYFSSIESAFSKAKAI